MAQDEETTGYDALSNKHKAFVDFYTGRRQGPSQRTFLNATQSYIAAGYSESTAGAGASRLLKHVNVAEAISEALDQFGATDAEAAAVLTRQMRGGMGPFLTRDDSGRLVVDLTTEDAALHTHLIRKIKERKQVVMGKDGSEYAVYETEIEVYDAQAAADKIRKAHGAYVNLNRQVDKEGNDVPVYQVTFGDARGGSDG